MSQDLIIDGKRVSDFAGFVSEFNRAYLQLYPGPAWDGDDFNDLDNFLESPADRYTIRWTSSDASRLQLGHDAMAEFWGRRLMQCLELHPAATSLHRSFQDKIKLAVSKSGPTLFDYLVEQLSYPDHCDLVLEQ